ncbi:hypothetical protein D3C72_2294920 [compost metagenome]
MARCSLVRRLRERIGSLRPGVSTRSISRSVSKGKKSVTLSTIGVNWPWDPT